MQIRAEFYNLFNHPNLYIRPGTNDVNTLSFNPSQGQTVPGVTAFFQDSRQIVLALKLMFSVLTARLLWLAVDLTHHLDWATKYLRTYGQCTASF